LEDIGTGAHGGAGHVLHGGQVALGEAELVVLVVVQALVAVVVQGGDRQGQLVDHGGVDGVGDHPQGVIAGTHDTGDVGGGLASLHVDGGVIVHVLGNQVRQGGTSGLSLHGGPVPVVGVADGQGEVLHSGVLRQAGESPACSGLGHGGSAAATLFNGSHHIVHDLLSEGHQAVVHSGPESGLLLLGHQGEVGVVLTQLAQ